VRAQEHRHRRHLGRFREPTERDLRLERIEELFARRAGRRRRALATDKLRYGELGRAVGALPHEELKELEADGIVKRVDHRVIPLRFAYLLTTFGWACSRPVPHIRERAVARRVA